MSADDRRLAAINSLIDQLYDSVDELYECLVDEQYVEAEAVIKQMKIEMRSVSDSIKDETKR
jgi:hypothetical protein